jgi:hypothetical protein
MAATDKGYAYGVQQYGYGANKQAVNPYTSWKKNLADDDVGSYNTAADADRGTRVTYVKAKPKPVVAAPRSAPSRSSSTPAKVAAVEEVVDEPTQEDKRAEITKPPAGLESTISPGAEPAPVRNVSYLSGNTQAKTKSRFLSKKNDRKKSLFG